MAPQQEDIFGPFFAMLVLTIIVWYYMYARRLPFIFDYVEKHKKEFKPDDLGNPGSRHYLALVSPPSVRNPSDNLKNLFEVPILFYAMVMYLYATKQVDTIYMVLAWTFVAFRTIHSAIHCTFNGMPLRFYIYVIASKSLFLMIFRAAYNFVRFGIEQE